MEKVCAALNGCGITPLYLGLGNVVYVGVTCIVRATPSSHCARSSGSPVRVPFETTVVGPAYQA